MISKLWFQKNDIKKWSNDFDLWTKGDIHKILSDSSTACCVVIESAFKIKLTQKSCSSKKWFQKSDFKKVISKKWFQKWSQKFDQISKTKMNDGHCGPFVSKLVNKQLETF